MASMAEEIRTDADEMSCTFAKEIMASVAATYDRLAETWNGSSVVAASGSPPSLGNQQSDLRGHCAER